MVGFTTTRDGYPDRGPAVFAVTTATLILATIFVAGRLVSRIGIVRHVSWDDYFIVLAWIFAVGLSITIDIGTRKGLGRHDINIPDEDQVPLRKTEYVFSILYNPALMATKTSILIFYLRLSKNTQQVLRLASWVVLGIVNLAGFILTVINIFQCRPIDASFRDITTTPKCIPLLTEFICSAPINIVTDLAILALPIPVLTSMRLPTRQKTILVLTFALGIFVTIVDVVRIYYLQQAITNVPSSPSSDPGAIFGDSAEFPWNASLSLMWSAVEVNIAMTCACIPTLKPLIIKILPAMLIDPHGTRTAGSSTQDKEMVNESPAKHGNDGGRQAPGTSPEEPANESSAIGHGAQGITMMDFLTTPDMTELPSQRNSTGPRIPQSATMDTLASNSTRRNSVYFGFVNMKRPKSMIKTDVVESFRYCLIVTILFLLWGFSYGLLNTLNNVIATISNMTTAQTLGLTSVYFGGGYFFGPLVVGEWVLRHDEHARFHDSKSRANSEPVGGFKATFIMGLAIYGIGTIMFWPSAVMTSFAGFMISNFVVGFGLGVLETGANPFIVLCGPPQYAEMRLCISQGFQGVATVISGLLAQKVFFVGIDSDDVSGSLILLDVQWTYLAITLFCVALALFFYYMPLPEVSDEELARAATRLPVDPQKRGIGGLQLRTWCIILAVLAQWVYVAAQEIMSIYFHSMITTLLPDEGSTSSQADQPPGLALSVSNYLLIAHSAFALSRFNAAHLAYAAVKHPENRWVPRPRTVLTITSALSVLFALLCVVLRPRGNPDMLAIPVILFFFAEGPVWPLVFAIGLKGQGKRTKRAGAWLTMGASGPAFWPFVMYGIINNGGSVQTAFVLVVVLLLFSLCYPLYLTLVKDAKKLVDPIHKGQLVGVGAGGGVGGGEQPSGVQSSNASHLDLDAIVRNRQRNMSESSSGKEGFLRRVSKSFPARRKDTARTMSSSSPEYEHAEDNIRADEPTIPEEELRAL